MTHSTFDPPEIRLASSLYARLDLGAWSPEIFAVCLMIARKFETRDEDPVAPTKKLIEAFNGGVGIPNDRLWFLEAHVLKALDYRIVKIKKVDDDD